MSRDLPPNAPIFNHQRDIEDILQIYIRRTKVEDMIIWLHSKSGAISTKSSCSYPQPLACTKENLGKVAIIK